MNVCPIKYFFVYISDFSFMATLMEYGSSQAMDWISAVAVTYTTAAAMPDPLTHCAVPGIETAPPQWPKPLMSYS